MIFVLEEVMHSQPEIFQAELTEVLPSYGKRIKVVLFEISPKLALPLLVFAPHKADDEEKCRHDDRRNHVDPKLALQGVNHIANTESQISNQTGERDVFDERVRWAR